VLIVNAAQAIRITGEIASHIDRTKLGIPVMGNYALTTDKWYKDVRVGREKHSWHQTLYGIGETLQRLSKCTVEHSLPLHQTHLPRKPSQSIESSQGME
jgi:hypothetical protein